MVMHKETVDILDTCFEKEFLKDVHFMVWDMIVESPFPILPEIKLSRIEARKKHILEIQFTSYNINDRLDRITMAVDIPFANEIDMEMLEAKIETTIDMIFEPHNIPERDERRSQDKLFSEYIKYR